MFGVLKRWFPLRPPEPFPERQEQMWLFVGLGNPGPHYAGHRHNIGFMVVEAMAAHFGFSPFRAKFQGLLSEGAVSGEKIILLKPQTYMNESGHSVRKVADFYKIAPDRIVAFHDELDLLPCKVKVKTGGGLSGHNGLKSLKAHLGTDAFHRVRIGIGHPGQKERVTGHVLGDFSKAELPEVQRLSEAIAEHAGLLLTGKYDDFMTKLAAG